MAVTEVQRLDQAVGKQREQTYQKFAESEVMEDLRKLVGDMRIQQEQMARSLARLTQTTLGQELLVPQTMEDHIGKFRDFQEQFNNRRLYDEQVREAITEVKERSQTGTLQEYLEPFSSLLKDGWMEEELVVSLFLGGLTTKILNQLSIFKPQTLDEAYALVRLQELIPIPETPFQLPLQMDIHETNDKSDMNNFLVNEYVEDGASVPATDDQEDEKPLMEACPGKENVIVNLPHQEYSKDDDNDFDSIAQKDGQLPSIACYPQKELEINSLSKEYRDRKFDKNYCAAVIELEVVDGGIQRLTQRNLLAFTVNEFSNIELGMNEYASYVLQNRICCGCKLVLEEWEPQGRNVVVIPVIKNSIVLEVEDRDVIIDFDWVRRKKRIRFRNFMIPKDMAKQALEERLFQDGVALEAVCVIHARKQSRTCRTSLHHICARETKYRMVVWGKFGENNVELRACSSNLLEVHLGGVHLYSEVDEADGLEGLAGSDASDCSELQDELLKDVKPTCGHISTRDAWQLEYVDKVSSNHCEEAETSDHLNLLLRLDLKIIIEQGKTLKAAQGAYNEVRTVVVFAMGTLLNVGFDMRRDGGEDEYDDEKVMTQIIIDKILLNVVSSGSLQYCLGHDKHLLTDEKMNMSLFLYLELKDIQWAPFLLAMGRPNELDMEKDSIGKEHKSRKRIDMDSGTWRVQILHLLWLFWVEGRLKREDQIVALLLAILCFFVPPVGMLFELVQHGAIYSLLHFNGFLVEHSPLHVDNAVLASPMDLGKYSFGDQNNMGIQLNEAKSIFGEGSNLQLLPDCSFNSLEQTLGTRFLEGGSNVTGILVEGSFCKYYRDLNGNV